MTASLDWEPRRNAGQCYGEHVQDDQGKGADRILGDVHYRGTGGDPLMSRGRRGGASCAIRDNHLLRARPMGARGEGFTECAAAVAHRGTGGAQLRGPEPATCTREAGKAGHRCSLQHFFVASLTT